MSLCTVRRKRASSASHHVGERPGLTGSESHIDDSASPLADHNHHPAKRQCPAPNLAHPPLLTPSTSCDDSEPSSSSYTPLEILRQAQHVLAVEAAALTALCTLYATSHTAQQGLLASVEAILASQSQRGKLVIAGVGKSGYIAQKLVATCKSLGVAASFLHATEAVHGDLGDVREYDTLLLISHSAATPELHHLLPHLPPSLPLIALTSHLHPSTVPLFAHPSRSDPNLKPLNILLPAPIPESEVATFGVAAPTTSTTVSLAVADMLALGVAEGLVRGRRKDAAGEREGEGLGGVFRRNHPGGAIGMSGGVGLGRESAIDGLELERAVARAAGLLSPEMSGSDDG